MSLDFGLAVALHGYLAARDAVPDSPPYEGASPALPADCRHIHLLTQDFNLRSSTHLIDLESISLYARICQILS